MTLGGEQVPRPSAPALCCLTCRLETLFCKGEGRVLGEWFWVSSSCVYTLPRHLPQGALAALEGHGP